MFKQATKNGGGANFGVLHWDDWSPLQRCYATAQPVMRSQ